MFKNLIQKGGQFIRSTIGGALQHSGTAALYFGTSTLLAAVLLGAYLKYAWNIDGEKLNRALAILYGQELVDIQKAEQDQAAAVTYQAVLEDRARRLRENEYQQTVTQETAALPPPPEPPKPIPPPPEPTAQEKIDAYKKLVQEEKARVQSDGLAEETRLLANADPALAKEVIRKLWKEGANQRVLQMLLDMEEKPREDILYEMQQDNAEELKDLSEILQKIGDGEPMNSIIDKAANPAP